MLSLKLNTQQRVIECQRKAGFLGFLVDIESFICLFDEYVTNGDLTSLRTYKFSQDHLETFFGLVRSSLGCNNNPTVLQFRSAYRKLLLGSRNVPYFRHIVSQDCTEIIYPVDTTAACNYIHEKFDLGTEDNTDIYFSSLAQNSQSKELKFEILCYIAGYIQRKIQKRRKM